MLVTVDDLVGYMSGIQLSEMQRTSANQVLNGVQQDLETHLNRPLEPVQIREVISYDFRGYGAFTITPVLKIISVNDVADLQVQSPPYVPTPMERDDMLDADDRMIINGVLPEFFATAPNTNMLFVGRPYGRYIVEYVGGYNGFAIEGMKTDILRVAARDVERNHDNTVSLRGDNAEKASTSDDRVKGWTLDEKKRWDRYRRRTIV